MSLAEKFRLLKKPSADNLMLNLSVNQDMTMILITQKRKMANPNLDFDLAGTFSCYLGDRCH